MLLDPQSGTVISVIDIIEMWTWWFDEGELVWHASLQHYTLKRAKKRKKISKPWNITLKNKARDKNCIFIWISP